MRRKGFTLIEVFIVVVILGALLALAIPNFTAARDRVRKDMCVNNLRQLKLAKEHWALENNKDYNDAPVAANLDGYIRDGTNSLNCPLDGAHTFATSYNIGNIGTDPGCKISDEHGL
jgi:prepilin-type N-terminal cleavage/methylation domain-containing protein